MLKSTKKPALYVLTGIMAMGGLMVSGTSVHAAAPISGDTPVVYDNRNAIPDGNAQYGMIIPTALTFTDDNKTADATVEITGMNGYDLEKDWNELEVKASVKSTNSYTLIGPGDPVTYELKMYNNLAKFESNSNAQEITKHFGIGGDTVTKETGQAKLTGKATKKGQYKDTLTYSFEEKKNEKK